MNHVYRAHVADCPPTFDHGPIVLIQPSAAVCTLAGEFVRYPLGPLRTLPGKEHAPSATASNVVVPSEWVPLTRGVRWDFPNL